MSHPYNTANKQVARRGVACCPFLEFAEVSPHPKVAGQSVDGFDSIHESGLSHPVR